MIAKVLIPSGALGITYSKEALKGLIVLIKLVDIKLIR